MRCPECVASKQSHSVHPNGSTCTLMSVTAGYWDEDDLWVQPHDPNITTTRYQCSWGHDWTVKETG